MVHGMATRQDRAARKTRDRPLTEMIDQRVVGVFDALDDGSLQLVVEDQGAEASMFISSSSRTVSFGTRASITRAVCELISAGSAGSLRARPLEARSQKLLRRQPVDRLA